MLVILLLLAGQGIAQIRINSPYTRYGLGMLVELGLEPRPNGMGGIRFGLQRPDLINTANPASYVAFDTASFIFDAGVFGSVVDVRTDQLAEKGSYISLSHLLFGFPVTGWWKTSIGVLPFSYVGYDIYNNEYIENIGQARFVYQGSGGLNQLYWGNAFRITSHLSAGFNLKYIFGSIYRSKGVTFPDSVAMKNTFVRGSIAPSDFYGDIGFQYKGTVLKDYYFVAGLTFGPQVKIHSKANYLSSTYFGDINAAVYYRDTIEYEQDKAGTFVIPLRTGAGVTFGKQNNWMAGADFMWQNWEKYVLYGEPDSLLNAWHISAGGEYIPNHRSISSYFQRMSFRLGFHYGKTPLYLQNKHIDEVGISFGLGFPIRKSRTTVNASCELGKRGTTNYGLIRENYIRFTLGVNVFENWFTKSKYF